MFLLPLLLAAFLWLPGKGELQQNPQFSAIQHIKKLRDGNLLVMLPEDSPIPVANIKAQKYYPTVSAFAEHYKFSPVYFFCRVEAKQLRKRDPKTRLYNSNWQRVSMDALKGRELYISTLYYSEETNLPALVVLDSAFQHLPHPFPNPVRVYSSIPVLRVSIAKAVTKLDQRLTNFANENLPKKQRSPK